MPSIHAKTQVCAILGHPVGHSLSPAIHNAAFDALGLDYAYVAHDVAPDSLAAAIAGVRALGYRGLSVTIPHKVAALACVDDVDATARTIGCINTVVNDHGHLTGHNSDGLGALAALRRAGADPVGRRVVILGTGGAARALAVTLAASATPQRIVLLGVVLDELARLTRDVDGLGRCESIGRELSDATLEEALAEADLLLQCTPVGMHPKAEASLVRPGLLRPELSVFDAVYNPRRTALLNAAAAAGCRVVEGLEMFIGQAVVQFELWTGQPAPIDVMRRIVEERL
jgi:shikimate dehydrogenase